MLGDLKTQYVFQTWYNTGKSSLKTIMTLTKKYPITVDIIKHRS